MIHLAVQTGISQLVSEQTRMLLLRIRDRRRSLLLSFSSVWCLFEVSRTTMVEVSRDPITEGAQLSFEFRRQPKI
jgi:hypothetical protein